MRSLVFVMMKHRGLFNECCDVVIIEPIRVVCPFSPASLPFLWPSTHPSISTLPQIHRPLPSPPNITTMWPPSLEITEKKRALGKADQPFDPRRDGIRTPSPIRRPSRRYAHIFTSRHKKYILIPLKHCQSAAAAAIAAAS
jgi:hypothetical protein